MLTDAFGRHIDYLRVSLTDRCNFRCTYCMPEDMQFAPRRDNLALEELEIICRAFVDLGVKKIRLTGGEPLIHPEFAQLLHSISALADLQRIAITTNGAFIRKHIEVLRSSKVSQLNISLDSVDPDTFARITRTGELAPVLDGIDAAIEAGIERIRLNAVVSKGFNDTELLSLLDFAVSKKIHIAFIEEMPLGQMPDYRRSEQYLSSEDVKDQLQSRYQLLPNMQKRQQAGPARYYNVAGAATEVGFISPHSNNFCAACNRVRLTRQGKLVLCLGHDDAVDLRQLVRESDDPLIAVKRSIVEALQYKPESHAFDISSDDWQVVRFMNVTGG